MGISRGLQCARNVGRRITLIVLCAHIFVTTPLSASAAREVVPPFIFQDAGGQDRDLSEFRGYHVLLVLWASWCGFCVREMPALDQLAGLADQRHVKIVAISVDREPLAVASSFFKRHALHNLSVYGDGGGTIMSILEVDGLPAAVLIDPEGREIERFSGSVAWSSPYVRDDLTALAGRKLF